MSAAAGLDPVKFRGETQISVSLIDREYDAVRARGPDWWLYAAFDCRTLNAYLDVAREPGRPPWRKGTVPKEPAHNAELEATGT